MCSSQRVIQNYIILDSIKHKKNAKSLLHHVRIYFMSRSYVYNTVYNSHYTIVYITHTILAYILAIALE